MWPEGLIVSFASDVRKSFCHRDHRKHRGLGMGNSYHEAHRGKRRFTTKGTESTKGEESGSLRTIRPGLDTARR